MKIKDICEYGKKSKIKAGEGLNEGNVKLFTSSSESNKFVNEEQFSNPGIIMGTGGNATLHYCDEPFSVSTDCLVLFPKIKVSPKYLYYFFKGNFHVLQSGFKGAGLKHTSKKYIDEISINHIPNNEEQIEIVKILDNVNDIILKKNQQLSEYDQLIKSRFVEMFGDIDLNIKKETWIKLGNITEIVTGTTPSTHDESNWDGNYLWITPAELNDDSFYVYDTERRLTEKGLISKSLKLMPKDTVLLSTRAPIGKTAIVGNPMTCNQGFKNFICKDSLNPIYLFSLLKFNKEYLNSIGTGTTFKEISKTTVSNIEIPVPDIKMQNQFADFIKQVDKLKFEDNFLQYKD
jgi:type I restriction enzyme S subunit